MNGYLPLSRAGVAGVMSVFLWACSSTGSQGTSSNPPSLEEMISGMHIVDCLLPGQVRSLGKQTYLTARRPIKTTASDCNIRGGEYVAYDRADYKSALNVWMPAAKAGDAEAQAILVDLAQRIRAIPDPALHQTKFMQFMERVGAGEVRIGHNRLVALDGLVSVPGVRLVVMIHHPEDALQQVQVVVDQVWYDFVVELLLQVGEALDGAHVLKGQHGVGKHRFPNLGTPRSSEVFHHFGAVLASLLRGWGHDCCPVLLVFVFVLAWQRHANLHTAVEATQLAALVGFRVQLAFSQIKVLIGALKGLEVFTLVGPDEKGPAAQAHQGS